MGVWVSKSDNRYAVLGLIWKYSRLPSIEDIHLQSRNSTVEIFGSTILIEVRWSVRIDTVRRLY